MEKDQFDEEHEKEFWGRFLPFKDDPRVVRVEGQHYIIRDEHDHLPGFKGHGGATFYIQFHDGRLFQSSNLWTQGKIPEQFKEALPDNAKFLTRAAFEDQVALQFMLRKPRQPEQSMADITPVQEPSAKYQRSEQSLDAMQRAAASEQQVGESKGKGLGK